MQLNWDKRGNMFKEWAFSAIIHALNSCSCRESPEIHGSLDDKSKAAENYRWFWRDLCLSSIKWSRLIFRLFHFNSNICCMVVMLPAAMWIKAVSGFFPHCVCLSVSKDKTSEKLLPYCRPFQLFATCASSSSATARDELNIAKRNEGKP